MVTPGRIDAWTLLRVACRSFLLQANWNFQRMQNVGFCYALYPVVTRLWSDPARRREVIRRHLGFFNTHPYCASLILGVVAHLEEAAAWQEQPDAETPERIKVGMMGPLAALGDTVYWAMLKPALALLGVGIVLLAPAGAGWPAWWGPILFLGLFTLAHLGLRVGGVFIGYRRGLEIVKDLRRFNPHMLGRRIGLFMTVILGALLAAVVMRLEPRLDGSRWWSLAAFVGLLTAAFLGLRRGLPVTTLFYLLMLASLAAGFAGWI